jgi:hypothetical protein
MKMQSKKAIISAAVASVLVFGGVAYAWNSDGKGNIRCGDGSSATAVQQTGGTWTVTHAGTNGKAGGSFATEGKAALYACGE